MRVTAFHYDKSKHREYQLQDGTVFVVDYHTDSILSNGYYHMPIVHKGLWRRVVSELIATVFNGDIKKASEVLHEVYKKPEYLRGNLYKYIYTKPRKDRQNKKLTKVMEYIENEGLKEDVKRELWKQESIGVESEQLGTAQCEHQLKTLKTRVGKKMLVKYLEGKKLVNEHGKLS
jgi:uncharacterized protein YidB (DUF937 family)